MCRDHTISTGGDMNTIKNTTTRLNDVFKKADVNDTGYIDDTTQLEEYQDAFERFVAVTGSNSIQRFKEFYAVFVPFSAGESTYELPVEADQEAPTSFTPNKLDIDGAKQTLTNLVQQSGYDIDPWSFKKSGFGVEVCSMDMKTPKSVRNYQDTLETKLYAELGENDAEFMTEEFGVWELYGQRGGRIGYLALSQTADMMTGESGQHYYALFDKSGKLIDSASS